MLVIGGVKRSASRLATALVPVKIRFAPLLREGGVQPYCRLELRTIADGPTARASRRQQSIGCLDIFAPMLCIRAPMHSTCHRAPLSAYHDAAP